MLNLIVYKSSDRTTRFLIILQLTFGCLATFLLVGLWQNARIRDRVLSPVHEAVLQLHNGVIKTHLAIFSDNDTDAQTDDIQNILKESDTYLASLGQKGREMTSFTMNQIFLKKIISVENSYQAFHRFMHDKIPAQHKMTRHKITNQEQQVIQNVLLSIQELHDLLHQEIIHRFQTAQILRTTSIINTILFLGLTLGSLWVFERRRLRRMKDLMTQEHRFRLFYENSPLGYHSLDSHGRILEVNPAWKAMLGFPSDEVTGKWFGEFLILEDRAIFLEQFPNMKTEREIKTTLVRMLTKNKGPLRVVLNSKAEISSEEKPAIIHCVIQDAANKEQATELLKKSEEFFSSIFVINPFPSSISHLTSGLFVRVNPAFEDNFEFTPDEVVGKTSFGLHLWVKPEQRQEIVSTLQENGAICTKEVLIRTKSGAIKQCLCSAKLIDYFNEPHIFSTLVDISSIKQAEQALRELSKNNIQAQEDERKRISQELHDGILQILASLKFRFRTIIEELAGESKSVLESEEIKDAFRLLEEVVVECRRLANNLGPIHLDNLGLSKTLETLMAAFEKQGSFKVAYSTTNLPANLPRETALHIYRIIQEALNNIARHSEATQVQVNLSLQKNVLNIRIEDNGCGFDAVSPSAPNWNGLGLTNMQERTRLLGGRFAVESHPKTGTSIHVDIPLAQEAINDHLID